MFKHYFNFLQKIDKGEKTMKEVKVEVIFDDAGKDIYLVEGKYINYDMYRIYRTIKQLEGRNNTKRLMGIGNLIDDEVINNYIEEFQARLDEVLKKDEDSFVGLFFIINGKLKIKKEAVNKFDKNLENFNCEISHSDWFNNELLKNKFLKLSENADYKTFLRGRIVYDNKNKYYRIYTNPQVLLDEDLVEEILKQFNIEEQVYMFIYDEHYLAD